MKEFSGNRPLALVMAGVVGAHFVVTQPCQGDDCPKAKSAPVFNWASAGAATTSSTVVSVPNTVSGKDFDATPLKKYDRTQS